MTDALIVPGQHVCLAGISGQNQAGVGRENIFNAVVSPRRPMVMVFADSADDDSIFRHFSVWGKARGRAYTKQQIIVTDAHLTARDAEHFFAKVDGAWKLRPSPSPIFYRDMSGEHFKLDRWFGWTKELTAMYRAAVLTVCQLGPHPAIARPVLDVPADLHWTCEDNQRHVTVKCVERGDIIEFQGKPVQGGLVFNAQREAA